MSTHGIFSFTKAENQADVEAIRKRGREWDAAIADKDLERVVSFFAQEDVHTVPNNAPATYGIDGVRRVWQEVLALPGLVFTTQDLVIEVANSGDLAYVLGAANFSFEQNGQRITSVDNYVLIYRKVAGDWKLALDISNSTQSMH